MDDTGCRGCFLEPVATYHRQYEALRAFFIEGRRLHDIAQQFGEQPTRLRILGGESPLPSIARFGRQAYPGRGEVTNHEVLGWRNHGCHTDVPVAVGATGVVSKPAGLNIKE